jgi:hypothetical protein
VLETRTLALSAHQLEFSRSQSETQEKGHKYELPLWGCQPTQIDRAVSFTNRFPQVDHAFPRY